MILFPRACLFLERRQTGGGHGLPDAAAFFVRNMQCESPRDLREFLLQNLASLVQHDVPALAGRDAAKNEDMLKIIKVRVVRNGVAEITPMVS